MRKQHYNSSGLGFVRWGFNAFRETIQGFIAGGGCWDGPWLGWWLVGWWQMHRSFALLRMTVKYRRWLVGVVAANA
jgi:hypothetical protein